MIEQKRRALRLHQRFQNDVNDTESEQSKPAALMCKLYARTKATENTENRTGVSTTSDSSVQINGMTA